MLKIRGANLTLEPEICLPYCADACARRLPFVQSFLEVSDHLHGILTMTDILLQPQPSYLEHTLPPQKVTQRTRQIWLHHHQSHQIVLRKETSNPRVPSQAERLKSQEAVLHNRSLRKTKPRQGKMRRAAIQRRRWEAISRNRATSR